MRDSADAFCFPRGLMRANSRLCRSVTPTSKAVGRWSGRCACQWCGSRLDLRQRHGSGMLGAPLPWALRLRPYLFGSELGVQRVPLPPAAAWPGRQPFPTRAPCSLMPLWQLCPSPCVIPQVGVEAQRSQDRPTALWPGFSLVSSTANRIQRPLHLPWGLVSSSGVPLL